MNQVRFLLFAFSFLFFQQTVAQRYLEMIESGEYSIKQIQKEAESYFDKVGRERGKGYKPFKRWEYVAQLEADEAGFKIPNHIQAQQAREYRLARKMEQQHSAFGGDWKQLGPTYWSATSSWNPGVGRVTSIGIDEDNYNHLIVGSPTGGVWKTLDGGNTWTPLTDEFSTVDVFSLEISHHDNKQYLWGSTSGRIYRSVDGGATWSSTSNVSGSGRVIRLLYHPTDPTVVYAVSESNGLFRSANAGATWSAVTGASGVKGYDVEFKPGDPNTIYFSGVNVYRSTNGGSSFNQISGFAAEANNYKMIGVSPANPSVVYVLESNGGVFGGFYKSTNSGASYSKLIDGTEINFFGYSEIGDDDRGQAPRDMDVAVSPYDAEEVHIAGIHTWKSIDGGLSFDLTSYWVPSTAASLGVGYNHADVDILKFAGDTLFVGTDGGIYMSLDNAKTFIDRSSGLGIREFYKIGVSKTDPNVVSGGSQDNGTSVMRGANRKWVDWLGADGMESFVDWSNPSNLYGTSQYGSMYRSTNQGNSYNNISSPPDTEDGAWVTPFEQDPQVPATIYVALADIWKSEDRGGTWTKISTFDGEDFNQMKLAPSDNKRIYASRGSSLFTTADGGANWTTINPFWGNSTISYIAVHPQNPQRLLIVTSANVYHSTDAGANWTNISAGLPSGSKYCATWEDKGKNGIYVGSFGAISYTNDDLNGQWIPFLDGLPNVRVYELEINYISNTIFAGTYGRGLWESPLYQIQAPVAAFQAQKRAGCVGLTVDFTDKSTNNPASWEWTFEGGTPSSSNLQHPTVTYSAGGTFKVSLKTTNFAGESLLDSLNYIVVYDPATPQLASATRCGPGELTLKATAVPGNTTRWYESPTAVTPLYTGADFSVNTTQTTTYYAANEVEINSFGRLGPVSKNIGGGNDHNGNQYIILDVFQPFRLKSALVYAVGAKNRAFQLRNASGVVVVEKIVFVPDGESRVLLDMDIPVGTNLRLTCATQANLFRNNSGVTYPYTLDGVVQIKGSSGGANSYYYYYDMELVLTEKCASARVPVQAIVETTPVAPTLVSASSPALCTGQTVVLNAENVCNDCSVMWSNGATGNSITVGLPGTYTARVHNPANSLCVESAVSNAIDVTVADAPVAPEISATGPLEFCSIQPLQLSATGVCSTCVVSWSNGAEGINIEANQSGIYAATQSNACGASPSSNTLEINAIDLPDAPVISNAGANILCPGESVLLSAANLCQSCTLIWSTGANSTTIQVEVAGVYTAELQNVCGASPPSNAIEIKPLYPPPPAEILMLGQPVICPNDPVELMAAGNCQECTFIWSNGATTSSITVETAGEYYLTQANYCGISQSSNVAVIEAENLPPLPGITIQGPTALCPEETVALLGTGACPGCQYLWSNGATTGSIIVGLAGAYSLALTNVCGIGPSTTPVEISQYAPFVPVIQVTELCKLSAPAGSDYQWYADGAPIAGANTQNWTAQFKGDYSVSMKSPDGCPAISAPVTAEACVSAVSNPSEGFSLKLYPNPADDVLFAELHVLKAEKISFVLYAADGRYLASLYQGALVAGKNVLKLQIPSMPAGVYQLRFTSNTQNQNTWITLK